MVDSTESKTIVEFTNEDTIGLCFAATLVFILGATVSGMMGMTEMIGVTGNSNSLALGFGLSAIALAIMFSGLLVHRAIIPQTRPESQTQ